MAETDSKVDSPPASNQPEEPTAGCWWIDGKAYNFRVWRELHPGGSLFFEESYNRDISAAFHGYHKDPKKLGSLLETYEIKDTEGCGLAPYLNVPKAILAKDFNANQHVPKYDWDSKFMEKLRERINTKEMQAKIKQANFTFDCVSIAILFVHLLLAFPIMAYDLLPPWLLVLLLTYTRTAGAGIGHYHSHRAKSGKVDWGESLFDMQYVTSCFFSLADAHVMVHHLYTETKGDAKRTLFSSLQELPRVWRVPVFTLYKFGHFATGFWFPIIVIPLLTLLSRPQKSADDVIYTHVEGEPLRPLKPRTLQWLGLYITRGVMTLEFLWAVWTGHFAVWFAQFTTTTWVNLFLIVSSHDFHADHQTEHCGPDGKLVDWGVYQVGHCIDQWVTGIKHIDCFLTAGIGIHRVHHVLPWLGSAYSEILCEKELKKTCEEFNVEWKPAVHFYGQRIWQIIPHYLLAPPIQPPAPETKGKKGKGKGKGKGKDGKDKAKAEKVVKKEPAKPWVPQTFMEENFSMTTFKDMILVIISGFTGARPS